MIKRYKASEEILNLRIGIEVFFEALGWIVDIITGIAELSIFKNRKWRAALITIILIVPAVAFLYFLFSKL
ncbi:hypothetical protein [Kordiimonas sp. SCSIO 12610]|uniref:hypothetical protein n=1 Tax=Kordiimonas sp. SCSIO 12610 TaxID=2829597 RepID=UPI00210CAD89|nr:hypothetical protein [Kordiimonas sp. SCSIO 12610]UTW56167.1 hypothetical protein KFF44_04525 [Kordiimonas sp. SCSIO 12610]